MLAEWASCLMNNQIYNPWYTIHDIGKYVQNCRYFIHYTFWRCPSVNYFHFQACAVRDDVNECRENNGGCDTFCINTADAFYCECNEGFQVAADGLGCAGENRLGCHLPAFHLAARHHRVLFNLNCYDLQMQALGVAFTYIGNGWAWNAVTIARRFRKLVRILNFWWYA